MNGLDKAVGQGQSEQLTLVEDKAHAGFEARPKQREGLWDVWRTDKQQAVAVCDAALEVQEARTYSDFQSLQFRSLTSWRSADNVRSVVQWEHWGCPAGSPTLRILSVLFFSAPNWRCNTLDFGSFAFELVSSWLIRAWLEFVFLHLGSHMRGT